MLLKRSFLLGILVLCLTAGSVYAVPPIPGTYDPETMVFYKTGAPVPVEHSIPGPLRAPSAYRGVWYFPVIFIHANDEPNTYTVAQWAEQLFTVNTHPTGSFRDYYREVSYQKFDIQGETWGWFTADYDYAHYTNGNYGLDGGAAELAREAVMKTEAAYHPDWSRFDNDGDGKVDGVLIIHQGPGGEGGDPNHIWSHVSNFDALNYGGVEISKYSIQPETRWGGEMETIGTICHEHGHVLGLPDLYDISYTAKPAPVGKWCLMAEGASVGNPYGSKPGHFCGWSKSQLGWANVVTIDTEGSYTINYSQGNAENSIFRIPINSDPDHYFILENRWMDAPLKFDGLPRRYAGGLMIYLADDHVGGSNNGNGAYWRVELKDAVSNPPNDLADAGFCADTGATAMGPYSDPNSDGHYLPSNIYIHDISARGSSMIFTVNFFPTIVLDTYDVLPLGNQYYKVLVNLKNLASVDANAVTATMSTNATNVVFDQDTDTFGAIAKGGGTASGANGFIFHTTNTNSSLEVFKIVAVSNGSFTSHDIFLTIPVNPSQILIVDDDATRKGKPQDIEHYYEEALDRLGFSYETWEVLTLGYPKASIMSLYNLVIWEDGKAAPNAPKAGGGLDVIKEFLDMGGDLFWSSHEFIYSMYPYSDTNNYEYFDTDPGTFIHDYLHITTVEQDEYFHTATGMPGTIFDGLTYTFEDVFSDSAPGDPPDGWWPDEFYTDGKAIPVLTAGNHDCVSGDDNCAEDADPANDMIVNGSCGLLYQDEYRLMFMTVPVEGLPLDTPDPLNRQSFFKKVFAWFGIEEGMAGIDIDLNQSVFTAGDYFKLSLKTINNGPDVTADVFVALETYGLWFFWPSWSVDVDYETRDLVAGYSNIETLLEFDWPDGAGSGAETRFWAIMINHNTGEILSNYDFCSVSWQ